MTKICSTEDPVRRSAKGRNNDSDSSGSHVFVTRNVIARSSLLDTYLWRYRRHVRLARSSAVLVFCSTLRQQLARGLTSFMVFTS